MSDKYVTPHDLPPPDIRELLIVLMEECAEVQQAASKALRFGLADGYPGADTNNHQNIADELGDLLAVADVLAGRGVIDPARITNAKQLKVYKLATYLQHGSVG